MGGFTRLVLGNALAVINRLLVRSRHIITNPGSMSDSVILHESRPFLPDAFMVSSCVGMRLR